MVDFDNNKQMINCPPCEDEALMYENVICGDAELLYLDTLLREILSPKTVN